MKCRKTHKQPMKTAAVKAWQNIVKGKAHSAGDVLGSSLQVVLA